MKYTVETTEKGYIETLEVNGKEYKKTYEIDCGYVCREKCFSDQLKDDFYNEYFLEEVRYEIDNSFFANNFKNVEEVLH